MAKSKAIFDEKELSLEVGSVSHLKGNLVSSASRKNSLTKMVLATARTSRNQAESNPLSLAELRENLIKMDAIAAFENAEPESRLARWMGRSRQKAVSRASERPETSSLFPAGPLFKSSRK